MPLLSAFTPCGHLECSSRPAHGEEFYGLIKGLYQKQEGQNFDFTPPVYTAGVVTTPGTYAEAKLYAWAMGAARVLYELEHARNQQYPLRSLDLLPLLELDYGIIPGPYDSIPVRQAAVAAAELLPNGAKASNLVNGLRAILGANFLGVNTAQTPFAGWTPTTYPATPGTGPGHFTDVRVPARMVQLVDPVVSTGSPVWCAYQPLSINTITNPTGAVQVGGAAQVLYAGDVVVVQGENTSQAEKVTITQVATQPPAGSNASAATLPAGTTTWASSTNYTRGAYVTPTTANANGFYFIAQLPAGGTGVGTSGTTEPTWPSGLGQTVVDGGITWTAVGASFVFQATFTKAHDVGATVTTGNFPYWWSTQRVVWIIMKAAAATDRESRRKVDAFLGKVLPGVTQWAQLSSVVGSPVGPLTVNGAMGTQTIGSESWTASM